MKLVFDLDGVLRDLDAYLHNRLDIPAITDWFWKHKGKDIFEWIEEDGFNALVYAPTTKYYLTIKKYIKNIELWTSQPEKWRPYTEAWIRNNFNDKYLLNYLTTEEKQMRLNEDKGTYLVEDCPNFTDYTRIILVDTLYNKHVEAPNRVYSVKDLEVWLKRRREDEAGNIVSDN